MNVKRIGVDVDGTLASVESVLCGIIFDDFNVVTYHEDFREWGQKIPEVSDDWGELMDRYWEDSRFVPEMTPISGSVESVRHWYENDVEIVIATHRPQRARESTIDWLHKHDVPFDEMICGTSWDKSDADADVLIDDAIHNMHAVVKAGQHGILSLQYHNFDSIPCRNGVHTAADVLPHSALSLTVRPEVQWRGIRQLMEELPVHP